METECVLDMPVKQQLRSLKFLGTRICYYTNSSASFQINILIYGDINPNPGPTSLENKIITNTVHVKKPYERSELLALRSTNTTLPISLQNYIISLNIPTRKHRITHRGRCHRPKKHHESLAPVPPLPVNSGTDNFTRLCVLNAQSVCNKTAILEDHILEHDFDIIALTETWLSSSDRHKKTIGELTLRGYDFFHVPRPNRGGGGVGIIHKESISRAFSSQHEASSFESLSCDLTFKDSLSPIKLVILYRPHYSKKHRVTAKVFLDEFSEYVSSLTTHCK